MLGAACSWAAQSLPPPHRNLPYLQYKDYLGNGSCTTCPLGTTTTTILASVMLSDCDACRPGFGSASINESNPVCEMCGTGTYSLGGQKYGKDCVDCPKPSGFTGQMVSRDVSIPSVGAWMP